jgi:DNA-binding MarR family transcriptional regulator
MGHEELILAVMRAVAAFQDSTDLVDDAAAQRFGLNRTDLRLLGVLTRLGRITIGRLATASGLSPGAATTAVDRLTRAGYARRVPDDSDRRRVMVESTPTARTVSDEIWGPIGRESHRRLARRSDAELRVLLKFLDEGRLLQTEHAARIADQSRRLPPDDPAVAGRP